MTDPDFASFGEPNRSRPEGYRLTHPRTGTAPRTETASGSSTALTGFDPGRGSLGRPEATVAWTPTDIAPDWVTGATSAAEIPVGGPGRPHGRPDSLMSSPDSVTIGSEPGTPISDSVAIPRQSAPAGPDSGQFGLAAPWPSDSGSEFSAFLSHADAEPERPVPGPAAPGIGTGIPASEFGSPQPAASLGGADSEVRIDPAPAPSPPQLPRRTPGLPQRTPDFMHTTAEQSLFGELASESAESESGHHSNGSAFTSGDSASFLNGSAFTSGASGNPPAEFTPATNEYESPERHAADFTPGGTESVLHSDHAEPMRARTPAADSAFEPAAHATAPPSENTVRTGQLTGPATPEPAIEPAESPRTVTEPAPPADEAPNPPWLQPAASDRRTTTGSDRRAAAPDRYPAESGSHSGESESSGSEFEPRAFESPDTPTEPVARPHLPSRGAREFARRTAHSAPDSPEPHRTTRSARHADPAEPSPTGGAPLSSPTPDSRPGGTSPGATASRRSAHRRAATGPDDNTSTTVDVHLVMHLLLASHTLETVADKAEAGEASLEDFIRAARVTRTATVDLVSAWFGGTTQMRQFAEALLAASDSA